MHRDQTIFNIAFVGGLLGLRSQQGVNCACLHFVFFFCFAHGMHMYSVSTTSGLLRTGMPSHFSPLSSQGVWSWHWLFTQTANIARALIGDTSGEAFSYFTNEKICH